MNKVVGMGITVTSDFPTQSYDALRFMMADPAIDHGTLAYEEYGFAMNAVPYRFRACAEHSDAFRASIMEHGGGPQAEERYAQENHLFGFFFCGLSAVECLCYGITAIFHAVDGRAPVLQIEQLRGITVKSTAALIKREFCGSSLDLVLDSLLADNGYEEWCDLRNILSHRSSPGRIIPLGDDPAEWMIKSGLALDETTTVSKRTWLSNKLEEMLAATGTWTAALKKRQLAPAHPVDLN